MSRKRKPLVEVEKLEEATRLAPQPISRLTSVSVALSVDDEEEPCLVVEGLARGEEKYLIRHGLLAEHTDMLWDWLPRECRQLLHIYKHETEAVRAAVWAVLPEDVRADYVIEHLRDLSKRIHIVKTHAHTEDVAAALRLVSPYLKPADRWALWFTGSRPIRRTGLGGSPLSLDVLLFEQCMLTLQCDGRGHFYISYCGIEFTHGGVEYHGFLDMPLLNAMKERDWLKRTPWKELTRTFVFPKQVVEEYVSEETGEAGFIVVPVASTDKHESVADILVSFHSMPLRKVGACDRVSYVKRLLEPYRHVGEEEAPGEDEVPVPGEAEVPSEAVPTYNPYSGIYNMAPNADRTDGMVKTFIAVLRHQLSGRVTIGGEKYRVHVVAKAQYVPEPADNRLQRQRRGGSRKRPPVVFALHVEGVGMQLFQICTATMTVHLSTTHKVVKERAFHRVKPRLCTWPIACLWLPGTWRYMWACDTVVRPVRTEPWVGWGTQSFLASKGEICAKLLAGRPERYFGENNRNDSGIYGGRRSAACDYSVTEQSARDAAEMLGFGYIWEPSK